MFRSISLRGKLLRANRSYGAPAEPDEAGLGAETAPRPWVILDEAVLHRVSAVKDGEFAFPVS